MAMARPQGFQEDYSYQPYDYSYSVTDDEGNQQGHSSSQDANGIVTGTMFIQLTNGLFRQVNYVAGGDEGFRLIMESNEPGLGAESPADAEFNIQDPPPGIYEDRGRGGFVN